ncbi:AAA family ATPase [Acidithiobacillus sp. VAN18-1]|uniref:AAA family ATPase n=1 Tax=Igneacidithiobacillus copahuensis TaxID=2724909 RepID=A0AAE2YRP2_9PROT|nr:AAA family ATPase [Igneacidithiobacillus copahuensis]MBU2788922.1 AAA family ATPase [Igneacidithiobacillus copahuensis]MBU2795543.1 AAA family ATPase [Acidithiobacillus sp. VAN18-2]
MNDLAELFDAMEARGLQPPRHLEPGKRERFPDGGKTGDKAGWCLLFPDQKGAVFGSWRGGWTESWQAERGAPMTEAERAAFRAMVAKAKQDVEAERRAEYAAAAERAQKAWETAAPAPDDHPYLVAKKIDPDGLRVASDGRLMAPVHGPDGALQTLQYIGPDGGKMFLSGGKMAGGRFAIQTREDGPLVLVEGIATGKSIASAMPDASVAACFSATNLAAVAKDLRAKHPARNIVIAGDDDTRTAGNPGRTKAELAAQEIGAQAVFPPDGGDWNDYRRAHGIEATSAALKAAIAPPKKIFTPIGELLAHPQPVDWLVNGWLEKDTTAALIAEPGRGKSFAALDIACCVALGRDWHGIPTKQAPVLFLAGEGRAAMVRRACAWSIVYDDLSDAPLHLSSGAVTLNDPDALAIMQGEIDAMPEAPGLVIVDTLQRGLSGDENSAETMNGFVAALDTLRQRYGCTCLVIHHPSKATPGEPRGHSALKGAIDTMATLEARDGGVIVLINSKQRGSDTAHPMPFAFRRVQLPPAWNDEDGNPTESAILAHCDLPSAPAKPERGLGDKQRLALSILKRIVAEHERNLLQIGRDATAAKVQLSDWRKAAKDEGLDVRNFSRWASALEDKQLIAIDGVFVSLGNSSHSSSSSFEENEEPPFYSSSSSHAFRREESEEGATSEGEEGKNPFLANDEIIEDVEI